LYGSLWQYQERAEPLEVPTGERPTSFEPFLELLPFLLLGSFDLPIEPTDAYQGWNQPESVQVPELPAPQDEQWLAFVPRDERDASISWLDTHPPLEELPYDLLGSFDSSLAESVVAVVLLPSSEPPFIEALPDEALGYFDRSLDDPTGYSAWLQPEAVGLPPLCDPQDEQWLSFVARDEGPASISWFDAHPPFLEAPPDESLGSLDRSLDDSSGYASWLQPESVGLSALPDEQLGSLDRSPDDPTGYAGWLQPESVGLPPLPDPIDEQWLALPVRNESPFGQPWHVETVLVLEAEPELGGFFFSPFPRSIAGVDWLPIAPDVLDPEAPVLSPPSWFGTLTAGPALVFTSYGGLYEHRDSIWSAAILPKFEVCMLAKVGQVYARLMDTTLSLPVAASEVTTVSASIVLVHSGAIVLVDGHLYRAQFGHAAGDSGEFFGASLIMET
jgi:hypothetical protein